jgi:polyphosphate kinase
VTVVRYELRSADELESLARATLPGSGARAPTRTTHRDLYLDTADDALRQRGIVCRLRVGSGGTHRLSLHLPGNGEAARVEAPVRGASATTALAEESPVRRHLRSIVEPSALAVRLELEVERLTRAARRDLFGRARIELHLDRVTIRRDGAARTLYTLCAHHRRGPAVEFQRLVTALEREHALTPDASDPRERAALLQRWIRPAAPLDRFPSSEQPSPAASDAAQDPPEMLGAELSLLAFQRRVLALAEDPVTPLRERLRFLGIVTSNLDEFFMVRMPELRQAAAARGARAHERADDGMTPGERLDRVEREIASILAAQARCAETCLREAESHGTHVRRWGELTTDEHALLRARCRDEIYPALTPLAMTLSPGHPLPHLPHLGLSLAVVFRSGAGGEAHLAELEIPHDVERLLPVPGRPGDVVPIEDVLRANVDLLYPNAKVDGAWLFRVTRAGDLELDERNADDLLAAVADATERRPYNPAVRVEVERTMPHSVCELVLDNLRREAAGRGAGEAVDCEPETVSGLLDLRCLAALPLPDDPALSYPPLAVRSPLGERPIVDALADGEILVHHPFDDYEGTVVRFLREAAADPRVTTIKITLYRVGEPSAVVDALLAAAEKGKKVVALVELKARFDEEHNVSWARALEGAGAHVVYGFVGLKVHAKLALVVRREGAALRRYAHVSTGNYNTRSGRQYTDLSLFSAADPFTSDIADLFNTLTGSSRPPDGLAHGALVAPVQLLPGVLERIERETRNARLGLPASIAIKVNGLSDAEVVRALYRASQAGVRIELVVRGICTLRPGVAGRSEQVRVVSVVGRFLEHSRIYRFENGGAPELFIGSSDLRPRNLRRRVELLVPVRAEADQRRLEALLRLYLDDHTAWQLRPDGCYERTARDGPGTQAWLASDGALTPSASRSAAPTG